MSTNANVFNSRVTSEALEAKFRQVFPAQAGAELIQDLYASGVIQPVIDFSSVAEGSFLPANLQTAWDFATEQTNITNATTLLVDTPGFWKVDLTWAGFSTVTAVDNVEIFLSNGLTQKPVWAYTNASTTTLGTTAAFETEFVVFLREGDELYGRSTTPAQVLNVWYRQIATVNGVLVNPLGFTFQ
jgi:hypothetical protein